MESRSYMPFSYTSAACTQLARQWKGYSYDHCEYVLSNLDGSYTTGAYASDTPEMTGSEAITDFQFGCNHSDGFGPRLEATSSSVAVHSRSHRRWQQHTDTPTTGLIHLYI